MNGWTKAALLIIAVIGGIFYLPYRWLRGKLQRRVQPEHAQVSQQQPDGRQDQDHGH